MPDSCGVVCALTDFGNAKSLFIIFLDFHDHIIAIRTPVRHAAASLFNTSRTHTRDCAVPYIVERDASGEVNVIPLS